MTVTMKSLRKLENGEEEGISLSYLEGDTPLPHQMEKFWQCTENKKKLQLLSRSRSIKMASDVVISGIVDNDELLPAKIKKEEWIDVPELENWQFEADTRLIAHVNWAVNACVQKVVVICNDSDVFVLLMRYYEQWLMKGLKELWMCYGTGNNRRMLPVHILFEKHGKDMCKVIVKAHVLTGDDSHSKIGTKHAAIKMDPQKYLRRFAESPMWDDEALADAKKIPCLSVGWSKFLEAGLTAQW